MAKHLTVEHRKKLSATRIRLGLSKGSKNPNFKNAKPFCVDCKQEIGYQRKRCCACHIIYLSSRICEKNGNWRNGVSFQPYAKEFTRALKKEIKERDNYICQNCYITEERNLELLGQVLTIHHVDYDKQNNKRNNLITLCQVCNSKANKDRDFWTKLFTVVLQ